MNDAQIWTLIGGFLAILAAMTGMVLRIVRVEIEKVMVRFDSIDKQISTLDRDVQNLMNRHFGQPT